MPESSTGNRAGPVNVAHYRPYCMSDVHRSSMLNRFTVVSTFSGGGGSSIGYKLAGGRVALVNEFVPEAARTYARNFPGVAVDGRDVRAILEREQGVESFLAIGGIAAGRVRHPRRVATVL